MTTKTEPPGSEEAAKRRITFERTFRASVQDVWDLWTTKEGLESWWGPEGFATTVRRLDLRPGGGFEYAMTATDPAQIKALKAMGMPLTTVARGTFIEISPPRRLVYKTLADFIPGVTPYEVAAVVGIQAGAQGVRMVVTEDAMHDEEWTKLSAIGMSSSLDKLVTVLEARGVRG